MPGDTRDVGRRGAGPGRRRGWLRGRRSCGIYLPCKITKSSRGALHGHAGRSSLGPGLRHVEAGLRRARGRPAQPRRGRAPHLPGHPQPQPRRHPQRLPERGGRARVHGGPVAAGGDGARRRRGRARDRPHRAHRAEALRGRARRRSRSSSITASATTTPGSRSSTSTRASGAATASSSTASSRRSATPTASSSTTTSRPRRPRGRSWTTRRCPKRWSAAASRASPEPASSTAPSARSISPWSPEPERSAWVPKR